MLPRTAWVAAAGAVALVLAGCGTSAGDAGAGGPGNTVTGKFGSTTVPAKPKRVVAMSWTDADFALSLGVVPVGMAKPDTPGQPDFLPWEQPRLGGQRPAVFSTADGDPVEQVAKLHPDVILATKDYKLDKSYQQLSQFAPVVTYVDGPNADAWQVDFRNVATALDLKEKGEQVIKDTEAKIAGVRTTNPELTGKTYTFAVGFKPGSTYLVSSTKDVSAKLLADVGLDLAPAVEKLPPSEIPGRAQISAENFSVLDADIIIAAGPTQSITDFPKAPVISQLPAIKKGAYVPLEYVPAESLGFPSPISLDWAVQNVVPKLAAAAKR